jgi:hypothetical protein
VPELHRNAHVVRDKGQGFVERRDIDLQRRRQLDQDRAELVAQRSRSTEEPLHRLLGILQLLDVCQIAAHLRRHDEIVRRAVTPLGERLFLRK